MLFTAHGVRWDGEAEDLALPAHLRSRLSSKAGPLQEPREPVVRIEPGGQTLYSAVSRFGGMEGQGPTSFCQPAAALAIREPQEEMGQGLWPCSWPVEKLCA